MSILAYKNCQNDVYKQYLPHRAETNHDAWPTIIDAQLTLKFEMGQGALRFLFFL